jgi:tetratricopeptide (TPR) repeat protein
VKALADYEKVVSLMPEDYLGWIGRGYAHSCLMDYDAALADFAKAVKVKPVASSYLSLGWGHFEKKDLQAMAAAFNRAVELDPRMAAAYSSRGYAYWWLGRIDDAIKDYSTAVRLAPEDPRYLLDRAGAFAAKKKDEEAVRDMKKASEIAPKASAPFAELGRYYSDRKKDALALKYYTEAIARDPEKAKLYRKRASVYQRLGEPDKAREDMSRYSSMMERK